MSTLNLLRLLHLSDSALPIGGAAHSFGLETLTSAGALTPPALGEFLATYLAEAGALEAYFCQRSFELAAQPPTVTQSAAWLALNHELSALKVAWESRQASLKLGNRLLHLVTDLEDDSVLCSLLAAAEQSGAGVHHACAFGVIGGRLGLDQQSVIAAFLRQMIAGLVAACQKLTPLGQNHAAAMQWALYAQIDAIVAQTTGSQQLTAPPAFMPMVEIASMRHPGLGVRLFVS